MWWQLGLASLAPISWLVWRKRLQTPSPEPHQPGRLLVEGVHCLYEPGDTSEIEFDIVFIHGLQVTKTKGFWWRTWLVRGANNEENPECWPEKWIKEEFPKARVLALEYNSCARGTEPLTFWNQAIATVNKLGGHDVKLGNRPFFLVGHSMGGLLAKEFLLRADQAAHREMQLPEHCKGIIFYGVPHLGAKAADWATFLNAFFFRRFKANQFVTEELRLLGERSMQRNRDFNGLAPRQNIKTFDFVENLETEVAPGMKIKVVPEVVAAAFADSANICIVQDANHYDVCRPAAKKSDAFRSFVNFVNRVLDQEGILHSERQLNIQ